MGSRAAGSERRASGAAPRLRAQPGRLARRHPRRLRHLPEPVGLQRADGVRAQPAVLLHQAGRRPDRRSGADAADARHPDEQRHRHHRRAASWTSPTASSTARRGAAASSTSCSRRRWWKCSYMGTWTLGADNATVRNVPEPGSGPDPGAPADPAVEPHQRDPVRRQVDLSRRDVQGRAPARATTSPTTSATRSRTRRTMRRARARPSRRRTSRRTSATSSTRPASGRSPASTTGISSSPAASTSCRSSAAPAASRRRVLGGWRANAIFIAQSGAPFTVNLSVDRANIGAGPAQRPDQLRDPNLPGGEQTPERWFDTSAFALQAPFTFGNAPRNSVIGPGFANVDFALAKTWTLAGHVGARVPVGDLQPAQSRELRPAEPDLRQPELRPHLQREESARDAVRSKMEFLNGGFASLRLSA